MDAPRRPAEFRVVRGSNTSFGPLSVATAPFAGPSPHTVVQVLVPVRDTSDGLGAGELQLHPSGPCGRFSYELRPICWIKYRRDPRKPAVSSGVREHGSTRYDNSFLPARCSKTNVKLRLLRVHTKMCIS